MTELEDDHEGERGGRSLRSQCQPPMGTDDGPDDSGEGRQRDGQRTRAADAAEGKGKHGNARTLKGRLVWPDALKEASALFISAVFDIGLQGATPKAILEGLQKQGAAHAEAGEGPMSQLGPVIGALTTEHIKSHLQKCRLRRSRSKQGLLYPLEHEGLHALIKDPPESPTAASAACAICGCYKNTMWNSVPVSGSTGSDDELQHQQQQQRGCSARVTRRRGGCCGGGSGGSGGGSDGPGDSELQFKLQLAAAAAFADAGMYCGGGSGDATPPRLPPLASIPRLCRVGDAQHTPAAAAAAAGVAGCSPHAELGSLLEQTAEMHMRLHREVASNIKLLQRLHRQTAAAAAAAAALGLRSEPAAAAAAAAAAEDALLSAEHCDHKFALDLSPTRPARGVQAAAAAAVAAQSGTISGTRQRRRGSGGGRGSDAAAPLPADVSPGLASMQQQLLRGAPAAAAVAAAAAQSAGNAPPPMRLDGAAMQPPPQAAQFEVAAAAAAAAAAGGAAAASLNGHWDCDLGDPFSAADSPVPNDSGDDVHSSSGGGGGVDTQAAAAAAVAHRAARSRANSFMQLRRERARLAHAAADDMCDQLLEPQPPPPPPPLQQQQRPATRRRLAAGGGEEGGAVHYRGGAGEGQGGAQGVPGGWLDIPLTGSANGDAQMHQWGPSSCSQHGRARGGTDAHHAAAGGAYAAQHHHQQQQQQTADAAQRRGSGHQDLHAAAAATLQQQQDQHSAQQRQRSASPAHADHNLDGRGFIFVSPRGSFTGGDASGGGAAGLGRHVQQQQQHAAHHGAAAAQQLMRNGSSGGSGGGAAAHVSNGLAGPALSQNGVMGRGGYQGGAPGRLQQSGHGSKRAQHSADIAAVVAAAAAAATQHGRNVDGTGRTSPASGGAGSGFAAAYALGMPDVAGSQQPMGGNGGGGGGMSAADASAEAAADAGLMLKEDPWDDELLGPSGDSEDILGGLFSFLK
ncbi:hypothetical protein JKP88DRAFT_285546 [Tribonema minus]|uniref:Uncharacterized protein n=1 Tax=Tribonema minus TaxID=303371 RepID=A0A835ZL50_9STRA|nr:hypothetical protein JKP88DRAFT_285546 [Tribonema minus]